MSSVKTLSSRKLDLAFMIYFIIHVPVMLLVDLVPFYPASLTPSIGLKLRKWYIMTYRDQFFVQPPAWFDMYLALEFAYHIPTTFWMLTALPRDHPLLPLHLLVYGLEVAITTLTCFVDMLSWQGYSSQELWRLGTPYGAYLGFSILMACTGFLRIQTFLLQSIKRD